MSNNRPEIRWTEVRRRILDKTRNFWHVSHVPLARWLNSYWRKKFLFNIPFFERQLKWAKTDQKSVDFKIDCEFLPKLKNFWIFQTRHSKGGNRNYWWKNKKENSITGRQSKSSITDPKFVELMTDCKFSTKCRTSDMFHMFRLQGDWIATEWKVPL